MINITSKTSQTDLCDLHTHSAYSDGTFTPEELVRAAKSENLRAVALTDHNTTDGIKEFVKAGKKYGVECIPGVEISSGYKNKELHIVALFFKNTDYSQVDEFLAGQRKKKEESNKLLAERLNKSGYNVNYDEIKSEARGSVNRVHFAKELIKNGYIKTVKEGFDTILSENRGIYVPSQKVSSFDVIKIIKSAGGVSILAHPLISLEKGELPAYLTEAKKYGLDAIETMYSKYNECDREFSDSIAEEFGLLKSGGSDFHGENKPEISLGSGCGNLAVPYDFAKKLEASKNIES